jgi:Fe-S-cluster containining protein
MTECKRCGSCCKVLIIPVHTEKEEDEEFYRVRGFKADKDVFLIKFPHRCPHLTSDNLCDIHNSKPKLCRDYPVGWDDFFLPDGCAWKK